MNRGGIKITTLRKKSAIIKLMLRWQTKIIAFIAIFTLLLGIVSPLPAFAATTCTSSVSIHDTQPAWSDQYNITVNNTGTTDINWIDITVPSSNFNYIGNSISNPWQTADHDGGTTITGSTITAGHSVVFSVSAATDISTASTANWQVKVKQVGGSTPLSCTGDLGTSISGHPPNDSMNGVSNVAVASITTSSAIITWDSDFSTSSLVYYGKTSNYGSTTPYNTTLVSSHSVTLSGLSAGTGYHFQVAGSDGQGAFVYSADNTFLTTAAPTQSHNPSSSSGGTKSPTASTSQPTVVINQNSSDKVPPQITLNTVLKGAYQAVPIFSGTASDNQAVASVEYSLDNGENWLPADTVQTLGQKKVTFSFHPTITQDGNYQVMARVTDSGNNTAATASQTLVIDRLPPITGGNVISVGPQIVQPDSNGVVHVVEGIDQKIIMSAVGGPTSVVITASTNVRTGKRATVYTQSFSLTQSPDTGLWSGVLSFARAGTYTLSIHALDGAGNKTDHTLNITDVASPGKTIDAATKKPLAATVTVYTYEPESGTWSPWDGATYGQQNSQYTSTKTGAFRMLLPAGKYYVTAKAKGYHALVGSIVTVSHPTPLTATLSLHKLAGPSIFGHHFSLPSFGTQATTLAPVAAGAERNALIGQPAPDFTLQDTTGATVHTADLFGKPTVLSFASTWSPTTVEQLDSLGRLQSNSDVAVLPVALQENLSRVQAYTTIANLRLRWLADPDSTLSAHYQVQSLPTSYFIDRKGIVRHVVVGIMTEKQITDLLEGL